MCGRHSSVHSGRSVVDNEAQALDAIPSLGELDRDRDRIRREFERAADSEVGAGLDSKVGVGLAFDVVF